MILVHKIIRLFGLLKSRLLGVVSTICTVIAHQPGVLFGEIHRYGILMGNKISCLQFTLKWAKNKTLREGEKWSKLENLGKGDVGVSLFNVLSSFL